MSREREKIFLFKIFFFFVWIYLQVLQTDIEAFQATQTDSDFRRRRQSLALPDAKPVTGYRRFY